MIWFSSHKEIGIFVRYVTSHFHPSFVHLHKPFKRGVDYRIHCVVSVPSVKTWMEGTNDIPSKNPFLCDYWTKINVFFGKQHIISYTVEPRYNEVLGTMKITFLYQVSCYIRVKIQRNIKSWDQQNYLVIRGFCYIRPLYNEVPL